MPCSKNKTRDDLLSGDKPNSTQRKLLISLRSPGSLQVGGQCRCKDRVSSRACDACLDGYFNLQADNPVGCEACNCNLQGTFNGDIKCHPTTGQCNCKVNVRSKPFGQLEIQQASGRLGPCQFRAQICSLLQRLLWIRVFPDKRCDACQFGYFNLDPDNADGCTACDCHPVGSRDRFCDPVSGQCQCKVSGLGTSRHLLSIGLNLCFCTRTHTYTHTFTHSVPLLGVVRRETVQSVRRWVLRPRIRLSPLSV